MKSRYAFRIAFADFYIDYPVLINFEFLSFHLENHARWITILGLSFIWEEMAVERVKK